MRRLRGPTDRGRGRPLSELSMHRRVHAHLRHLLRAGPSVSCKRLGVCRPHTSRRLKEKVGNIHVRVTRNKSRTTSANTVRGFTLPY